MEVKRLWIVTKPTQCSELGDICFGADAEQLQRQFAGGLDAKDIVGLFTVQKEAVARAYEVLDEAYAKV